MKGVIFAELVRFMETKSVAFADDVVRDANLRSEGAYTNVGNYPTFEALAMMGSASRLSGIAEEALCEEFGVYLFGRFLQLYPHIMASYTTAEALLTHVGSHIHSEVCILYPDSRPPRIVSEHREGRTILTYESHRPLAAIALGLIRGCMTHYGDSRTIEWSVSNRGRAATFTLVGAAHD